MIGPLGDQNDPNAHTFPDQTIKAGGTLTIPHTALGFQINDKNETLYLKNHIGSQIDVWFN